MPSVIARNRWYSLALPDKISIFRGPIEPRTCTCAGSNHLRSIRSRLIACSRGNSANGRTTAWVRASLDSARSWWLGWVRAALMALLGLTRVFGAAARACRRAGSPGGDLRSARAQAEAGMGVLLWVEGRLGVLSRARRVRVVA